MLVVCADTSHCNLNRVNGSLPREPDLRAFKFEDLFCIQYSFLILELKLVLCNKSGKLIWNLYEHDTGSDKPFSKNIVEP